MHIGTVKQVWRYPVKSLGGEQISSAFIQAKGIAEDRCWSIRDDVTGELVGGRKIPALMMLTAKYLEQPNVKFGQASTTLIEIGFPNGQTVRSDDPYASAMLSMFLGRRVSLIDRPTPKNKKAYKLAKPMTPAEVKYALGMKPDDPDPDFSSFSLGMLTTLSMYATPPGVLYDVYPLHLLTTSALKWISQFYPEGDFDVRRYRPSFLIETDDSISGIIENEWRGRELQIGDLRIKCNHPTIRCSMPGSAQPGLAKDPTIPLTLMKHAGQHLGAYATPLNEAALNVGDKVELLPEDRSKVYSWLESVGRRTKAQVLKVNNVMGNLLDKKPSAAKPKNIPAGFYPLTVINKVTESADVVSLSFQSPDGSALPRFMPGQHIVLALPLNNGNTTYRPYSLSSGSHNLGDYRISVKLKQTTESSKDQARAQTGEASGFIHRDVKVGDTLLVKGPNGQFAVHPSHNNPLVLISSGIGLTPYLSILHTLAKENPNRPVTLIHGLRHLQSFPFENEIKQLSSQLPNLTIQLWVSSASTVDLPTQENFRYFNGRIDVSKALAASPTTPEAQYLICGTPEFSKQLLERLTTHGVCQEQVLTESFGLSQIGASAEGHSVEVNFSRSGHKVIWESGKASLLELAEAQGISVSSGCRYGACQACEATLLSGEVTYPEGIQSPAGKNRILLCSAQPKANIDIEL